MADPEISTVEWVRAMVRTQFFDVNTPKQMVRTDNVVKLALELVFAEHDDDAPDYELLELVQVTALLHDINGWTYRDRGEVHSTGTTLAREWLAHRKYPDLLCDAVITGIQDDEGIIGSVVHDAVVLEAMQVYTICGGVSRTDDLLQLRDCVRTDVARRLLDYEPESPMLAPPTPDSSRQSSCHSNCPCCVSDDDS